MPVLALFTLTLAALIAGLVVGALLNRTAFERRIDGEVATLFAEIDTLPTYYAASELDGLPAPVQRYLARSLHEGAPHHSCVRTRESGRVRQRQGQPWTEHVGETYVVASSPVLLGFRRLRPLPLVWVDARTLYLRGRGYELTKLYSSITSVDEQDDATRQAVLVAYIAELPLVPSALLPADDRGWEPVDERSARFVIRDGELAVAGVFEFDELGNVASFTSDQRPYRGTAFGQAGEAKASQARWVVRYAEHRGFAELELPTKITVEWQLGDASFAYLERDLEAIELDLPRRFGAA